MIMACHMEKNMGNEIEIVILWTLNPNQGVQG